MICKCFYFFMFIAFSGVINKEISKQRRVRNHFAEHSNTFRKLYPLSAFKRCHEKPHRTHRAHRARAVCATKHRTARTARNETPHRHRTARTARTAPHRTIALYACRPTESSSHAERSTTLVNRAYSYSYSADGRSTMMSAQPVT